MGRKSVNKTRRDLTVKQLKWVKHLYPILNNRGLEGLTMNEIAKLMQKSKSTVYEYFSSKESLVESVLQFKLGELAEFQTILNNETIPFKVRYLDVMKHVSSVMLGISTKLLSDLQLIFPELWKRIEEFIDFATSILEGHYEEGIKNRVYNDIDPSILVMSDRIFFQAISNPQFLKRQGLTIQKAFDQYLQMKFYGMLRK